MLQIKHYEDIPELMERENLKNKVVFDDEKAAINFIEGTKASNGAIYLLKNSRKGIWQAYVPEQLLTYDRKVPYIGMPIYTSDNETGIITGLTENRYNVDVATYNIEVELYNGEKRTVPYGNHLKSKKWGSISKLILTDTFILRMTIVAFAILAIVGFILSLYQLNLHNITLAFKLLIFSIGDLFLGAFVYSFISRIFKGNIF